MKKALLTLIIFLVMLHQVNAVALGVNRASLEFNNVLRGGYAEDYMTATTDTPDPLSVEYEFTGEIAEWMTLIPNNESELFFSSEDPLRLTVIVEPPEDTANGTYRGELRLLTGPFSRSGGQFGSAVRASFAVKLTVVVTGNEIRTCTAGGFDIVDTETGYPLDFHATIKNTGNVRVAPNFRIDIWDQFQTKLLNSLQTDVDQILPTTQRNFLNNVQVDLPIGQYWAYITDNVCGNNGLVTFSVLELGGIIDQGQLLRIDNQPWAETNDIIRIAAIFKNLGTRVVSAKFKGTIEKEGKVVEVIDTDSLQVNPLKTSELETFFNAKEPGRYEVKGRVIYNNKLTFEKSSIINVQGDLAPRVTGGVVMRMLKNPYQVSMIFIVAAIAIILFLIRKEKRRRF